MTASPTTRFLTATASFHGMIAAGGAAAMAVKNPGPAFAEGDTR